jgi:tetratricopeptide (TPR) repeat protein
MNSVATPARPRRRDQRWLGVALTAAAVLLGGLWIARTPPAHAPAPIADAVVATPTDAELRQHFDAAVALLHARQYAQAAAALHRVIELAPRLPEAHVNLGFAMLGLQRAALARTAFENALALKPDQANAYYGLALAQESLGDLELALGAMRSYLHLARAENEAHLRRARAAVWEWESQIAARRAASAPGR